MIDNVLTTTVNPIPLQILELQKENALLSSTNKKLTKFLYTSIAITLVLTVVLIIQKNEDRK
jgi:hypothetical protein